MRHELPAAGQSRRKNTTVQQRNTTLHCQCWKTVFAFLFRFVSFLDIESFLYKNDIKTLNIYRRKERGTVNRYCYEVDFLALRMVLGYTLHPTKLAVSSLEHGGRVPLGCCDPSCSLQIDEPHRV